MFLSNVLQFQPWIVISLESIYRSTSPGDEIDKLLPSVQIKKLFNEGKLSSSEERSLQEFCSQYNVDETTCKSYVEHLEFLDAKAKKRE